MKLGTIYIDGKSIPAYSSEVLIVGTGVAGLNSAASLYKNDVYDILVISEGLSMGTSRNTGSDKQTYYKLTTCGSTPDSVRKMALTLFDGQSMDGDLALVEAALSLRGFYHLVDIGVPFPFNGAGEFVGYKTDHDPNQRGSSAGPLTSKYMTEALIEECNRYGIKILDHYQVIELLVENKIGKKTIKGLVALDLSAKNDSPKYTVFFANSVIYAVGGEAGMYHTSVYPTLQTGGLGVAFRAGVKGKSLTESQYGIASTQFRWNLSGTYQQVLPRYVSTAPDGSDEKEFLEGVFSSREALLNAVFLKGYQWPFDPRKTINEGSSLIDILVYQETMLKGRRVFLDYRRNPSSLVESGHFSTEFLTKEALEYLKKSDGLHELPIERLAHMNPAAIELYRSHGIDLYSEKLEIAVCAQHNNGGLAGNWWWESNIKGLFPVGEANGSHGVYRPGGSALNSGQCGSFRAAQYIAHLHNTIFQQEIMFDTIGDNQEIFKQIKTVIDFGESALSRCSDILDIASERILLQKRMSIYGANIRSERGVNLALSENADQQKKLSCGKVADVSELKDYYRLRDLLISQQVYLEAIADYIHHGGTSRGSYLIYDNDGIKPLADLPDEFKFSLEDKGFGKIIQEIEYSPRGSVCTWRNIRPIPEDDTWFEKVWRDYRNGSYYE